MRKRVRRGRRRKRPLVHKNSKPVSEGGFKAKPVRARKSRTVENDDGKPWWF